MDPQGRARGRARGRAKDATVKPIINPQAESVASTSVTQDIEKLSISEKKFETVLPGRGAIKLKITMHPLNRQFAKMNIKEGLSEVITRPDKIENKCGKTGREILLMSNFFKMTSKPNWCIYQYHVEYSPNVESLRDRRYLLNIHKESLGPDYIFDAQHALFLRKKLSSELTEVYSAQKSNPDEKICIKIKLIKELPPNDPICIGVFNLILKKVMRIEGMCQLGRNYYNPKLKETVAQHNLELWPGFFTSIREFDSGLMLNIDVAHKILRNDTVLSHMRMWYKNSSQNFKEICLKNLIGYNNKTYKIDDIDFSSNPQTKFKKADGTDISFLDYYRQQYSMNINDDKQPLLVSKPKKKDLIRGSKDIVLVPELCYLTGMPEDMKEKILRDIAQYTRLQPDQRQNKMESFLKKIYSNPESKNCLNQNGINFETSLIQYKGRVLPNQTMFLGDGYEFQTDQKADWGREIKSRPLISTMTVTRWIVIATNKDASLSTTLINMLQKIGKPLAINFANPKVISINDDRINSYLSSLENAPSGPQIVLLVVPNNRKDRYDAIKKYCCIDKPVPSQVVTTRTLMKQQQLSSIVTKIAVQMSCKLGGEIWAVKIPLPNSMVIGIDSYHDSSKKGRSVVGFVSSITPLFTKWFSKTIFQVTHKELLDGLKACVLGSLKSYHNANGRNPDTIIVYRDGVGDGQISVVLEYEVSQLQNALNAVAGGDYKPKIIFVIVTKRIGLRCFSSNRGQLFNPPPGTVIDSTITRPSRYDFYLVSQSVRQGTVSPTSFNVIYDTGSLQPDHIQQLSYKLTFMYYNWAGTVQVPAPCQYAHKLAFLVGQSVHADPHPDLSDKLYFL